MINQFFLLLFLSFFVFVFTESLASVFFLILFFLIGVSITNAQSKNDEKYGKYIFVNFYLIYTIFASLVFFYQNYYNLEFVHASDQIGFYNQSEVLGSYEKFSDIIYASVAMVLVNWNGGSAFAFGVISFISKNFFDGNYLLSHLFCISFVSSISIYFVYRILLNYFSSELSYRYTILFGFLSYHFYYSGFMLRDSFIALFYIIAIYLVHNKKFSFSTIFKLIILMIITYSFRNENGLFLLLFIPYYIYFSKKSDTKLLIGVTIIVILLFIGNDLFHMFYYQTFESIDRNSQARLLKTFQSSDAISSKLYNLPPVIKQISLLGFKLITPFPFWDFLKERTLDLIFINYSIAGLFSYYINGFLFLAFILHRKKIVTEPQLKALLMITFLYFFLNIADIYVRRIYYFYPILYILYLRVINQIQNKSRINLYLFVFYILLNGSYIILKA